MQILFLTQVLPYPLDAGPKTRAYYVLRHLAAAGHAVTLLSFVRETDSPQAVAHLEQFCTAVHTVPMVRSRRADAWHLSRSLAGSTPFLIARDWVPAMAARVDALCREVAFEAVHADQLWMLPYAERAARGAAGAPGQRAKPRLVLDQHNAVFQIPKRMAAGAGNPLTRALLAHEAQKLLRFEAAVCARCDRVVWVTQEDLAALENRGGYQATPVRDRVIPICVDPASQPVIEPVAQPWRVTFLGGLHWPPNAAGVTWFAQEVWPQVAAAFPDAVLTVIGKEPPALLRTAQAAANRVEARGYVDDPTSLLGETGAFIVPLHAGGGMRVKILDAWQWGLPVVSTTIGAEGVAVRPEENILLADDAATFAAAVTRVLAEPALAQRLREAGRRIANTQYDWRSAYAGWDEVYGSDG